MYLTASILDAFVVKNNLAPMASINFLHQQNQVFALASLSAAAKFIDGPGVYYKNNSLLNIKTCQTCTLQQIPLSQYVESWQNAWKQLQHNSAANLKLERSEKQILCQAVDIKPLDVQQPQIKLAVMIDWRFNRATPNCFLQVFAVRHLI